MLFQRPYISKTVLKIELSEGQEVVYLINFCIFIVSAFMKAVKHEPSSIDFTKYT